MNYKNQYKQHIMRTEQTTCVRNIEKDVTFTHPFDRFSSEWCKIKMNIKEINYKDGNTYYYISYTNTFSENIANNCHPLHITHPTHLDGDIIVKNNISDALIESLLMDDDELSKICGKSSPMSYRGAIMKNIANLWD